MRRIKRDREDAKWLKALGSHLKSLIKEKYDSPYEFWIESLGDSVSRSTMNFILNGEVDVKATTLRKLAESLEIDPKELLNFQANLQKK